MADLTQTLIQIKRSQGAAAPTKLRPGELAYSTDESTGKKLGVLFVGGARTDAEGYSSDIHIIGGKKYTTLLDSEAGVVSAGKAIVAGADGQVDALAVGTLGGVVTDAISGAKVLTIGDGKTTTIIHEPYIAGAGEGGKNVSLEAYVASLVTSGVALTAGNGIAAIEKNESGAFVIGLAEVGTAGTFGSETKIPAITVNEYGQITAVEEKTISTELAVDGNKVNLVGGKLVAGDGVGSSQSGEGEVTLAVDETVIRTTGGQTIAGTLAVSGQATFGIAPKVGEDETVVTDVTVGDVLVYKSEIPTTEKVGGIAIGSTFADGKKVLDLIDEMLHPYVACKGGALSLTKTSNNSNIAASSNVFEKGDTVTITSAKASWTSGSKMVNSVVVKNGSTQLGSKTLTSVVNNVTVTFDQALSINGDTTISAVITDGTTSLTPSASKISFVYPYYMGVVAAGTAITAEVVGALTKKVQGKTATTSHSFSTGGVEGQIVFAYPYTGALTSVMDPNNFQNVDSFSKTELNIVGKDGTSQKYSVWVANMNVDAFTLKFTHA